MSLQAINFDLQITPGSVPPVLHMSQYDSGRQYTAYLKDETNTAFIPGTGATAKIKGFNAAGVAWEQAATVDGSTVVFTPSGAATDQFGVMPVTIEITAGSEKLTPLLMIFDIQRAGYTNEQAVRSPEFQTAMEEAAAEAVGDAVVWRANQAAKTDAMTNPIGIDEDGKLWAASGDSSSGGASVNVCYFGATGDGTTDDTNAIQDAIDFAQTNGIRDVYFPSGNYKITNALEVTVATGTTPATQKSMYYYGLGCILRGESPGTTIISKYGQSTFTIPSDNAYRPGESVDTAVFMGGVNGSGLFLENLTIENASTNTDAYCVYATRARVDLTRVNLASASHGIFCYGWTNSLHDVIASCASKAIEMTNCTSTVLEKVFANGANPYKINASYTTLISCCGDGATGVVFDLTGNVAMVGCGSESPACDNYVAVNGPGSVATIDNFYAFAFSSANKAMFKAGAGTTLKIDGVRVALNATSVSGSYMLASTGAANITLKNAAAYDNGGGAILPGIGTLSPECRCWLEYGDYNGFYTVDTNGNYVTDNASDIATFFDVVGGAYVEVPDYTNLYNGKEDGYNYESGNTPSKISQTGMSVTVPVSAINGDTIRTKGINLRAGDMTVNKIVFFDSSHNSIFAASIYNLTGQGSIDWGGVMDAEGNLTYTITNDRVAALSNTAYVAVSARTNNFAASPAIAINEEIKSHTEYVGGSVTLKDGIKVVTPTNGDEPANKAYVDGTVVTISDASATISPQANHIYKCGTLSALTISSLPSGEFAVIFVSGSTATTFNEPSGMTMPDGFSVEANKRYEINVDSDGYALVGSWAVSA